jgi:hypothetical protein
MQTELKVIPTIRTNIACQRVLNRRFNAGDEFVLRYKKYAIMLFPSVSSCQNADEPNANYYLAQIKAGVIESYDLASGGAILILCVKTYHPPFSVVW